MLAARRGHAPKKADASARLRSVKLLQGDGALGLGDSLGDRADQPQARDPHLLVPFRELRGECHDGNTRDHHHGVENQIGPIDESGDVSG